MTDKLVGSLRFVAYSGSILADIDNPCATSIRAVLAALADLGHDVLHLELRKNPLLLRQLELRGSAAVREFARVLPRVAYRQIDAVPRRERGVGLARDIATADVILAFPGTPDGIMEEIGTLEARRKVRVTPPGVPGDLEMSGDLRLVPAVVTSKPHDNDGGGVVVVAYDDALSLTGMPLPEDWSRVVVGSADLPTWYYFPEVELPSHYDKFKVVVIVANAMSEAALARCLLPLAAGCHVVVLSEMEPPEPTPSLIYSTPEALTGVVDRLRQTKEPAPPVPVQCRAEVIARHLIDAVIDTLVRKEDSSVRS